MSLISLDRFYRTGSNGNVTATQSYSDLLTTKIVYIMLFVVKMAFNFNVDASNL